ncbi:MULTISPECIES: PP2C family serine/threonine-protein phosphatase [Proteus]|uniref:Protein phosphatase 2C domain-containing protein n=1 Tax=Proteus penneri TaxID=102862 RepID=A0ABS0W5H3_9GAMM|nr:MULTISPECIES: PP2C family serine/threonine-protein phosphatase [Proteus]MBJ2118562.1 protein phosphatase 2C domain-containing protein [Proteus penneri]NBM11339.1 protein phosphatase 2C domain-containing protein [Proteus sp. G2670]NBM32502.1 protein phosphatase 2C domain-containing protein [Proteus sp. G2664]NBM58857.1 protein phosphatase 2C domain-containing protein [Proteus sp. G2667]NBM67940.1 protein phosphatase 2C domain-containing protein [Proteus sp. G2663]
MDKKALLTKLIIDDTLTSQRIAIHEELIIALYEDAEIAQYIDFIISKIKAKTAEKITPQDKVQPILLLLPPARDLASEEISLPEESPLKPGQIPTHSSPMPIEKPIIHRPTAKITLSNAKVGTAFNSTLSIELDTLEIAKIEAVDFPEVVGISFDPESCCLVGTPTKSGNFTLIVHWSVNAICYHDEVLLIINPDPRSLWQINEPPADSLYPKAHIDSKLILKDNIRIAGASRRGRSHEHAGTFRDDDFYIHHDNQSQWNILIVADGAGSARYSREGSRIAINTVSHYLKSQLSVENKALKPHLETIHQWNDNNAINQLGSFFAQLFRNAAQLAINNLKNEAIHINEPVKSFSTTLLATVSLRINDELFAASFWMGDGAIAAYGPAGKVRILGIPDSGEYAGQTRFLDDSALNDAEFNRRIIIGKWKEISHLILMTDGVSDPVFETDNGLQDPNKWAALIDEISPCLASPETADQKLAEWLNFFSAGNHDDRTLVVAW